MTKTQTSLVSATPRTIVQIPLRALAVAPENMRAAAEADDGIDSLAGTILANGVLLPLHVRPPADGEAGYQILDGRRRFLALQALQTAGRIAPDPLVDCLVVEDQNRQIATTFVPNTERLPASHADMVEAIVRLKAKRLGTSQIGKILGYRKREIDQLDFIAMAHPAILAAMKASRLGVTDARKIARIPSRDLQKQFAQRAAAGERLLAWEIEAAIKGDRIEQDDPAFVWVGEAAYIAAGGKLEQPLFDDMPAYVDAAILSKAFNAKLEDLCADLSDARTQFTIDASARYDALLDLADREEPAPSGHGDWEIHRALHALPHPVQRIRDGDIAGATEALIQRLRTQVDLCRWGACEQLDLVVEVSGNVRSHNLVSVTVYADAKAYLASIPVGAGDVVGDHGGEDPEEDGSDPSKAHTPVAPPAPDIAPVDVEGVSNILHFIRTSIAQAGLARDLADHPTAALILIAHELMTSVGRSRHDRSGQMTGIRLLPPDGAFDPIAVLDGVVLERIQARKASMKESGKRQIDWIASLDPADLMALLAELAALTLTLREPAKTAVRMVARADARTIAERVDADISRHWTPDSAYFSAHSKALLQEALEEMGVSVPGVALMKKPDLVALCVQEADSRRIVPQCLSYRVAAADAGGSEDAPALDPAAPDGPGDDMDPDDMAA